MAHLDDESVLNLGNTSQSGRDELVRMFRRISGTEKEKGGGGLFG